MMKKNPYIWYILILVVFGQGCRNEVEDSLYRIPLEEALKAPRQLESRNYIDHIEYIPLETTDSCFISDIYKIERWKDRLYISDMSENLYLFSAEGKFIRKIGTKGRGAGEYNALTDFAVDQENGDIFLVAWGKTMVYDTLGQLKRSFEVDPDWQVCTFDQTGCLIFIAPVTSVMAAPFQLLNRVGKTGKVVRQLEGSTVECGFGCFNWISRQGDRVFYKEEFADTLRYVDTAFHSHAYAVLDWENYKYRPELFYMKKMECWDGHYRLHGMFDFKRVIVMNLQQNLLDNGLILEAYWFDKQTGELGIFEKNEAHHGFVIEGITYYPRAASEDRLVCVVPVLALPDPEVIRDERLQKIATGLNTDANPIIAFLSVKE